MIKVFPYNLIPDLSERGMVLDLLTRTTNGSVSSPGTAGNLWLHKLELWQGVSVSTLLQFSSEFSSLAIIFSVFTVSFRGNLNGWRLNITRCEVSSSMSLILYRIKKKTPQLLEILDPWNSLTASALLKILLKFENILSFIICQRSIILSNFTTQW